MRAALGWMLVGALVAWLLSSVHLAKVRADLRAAAAIRQAAYAQDSTQRETRLARQLAAGAILQAQLDQATRAREQAEASAAGEIRQTRSTRDAAIAALALSAGTQATLEQLLADADRAQDAAIDRVKVSAAEETRRAIAKGAQLQQQVDSIRGDLAAARQTIGVLDSTIQAAITAAPARPGKLFGFLPRPHCGIGAAVTTKLEGRLVYACVVQP